jgi:ankyrin repeat protein
MDPNTYDDLNIDGVKALIESGFDIETQYGPCGATILQHAARKSHIIIVKYLIDIGAKVNTTDKCIETPLHDAARAGCIDIVKYLLESGIDKFAKNNANLMATDIATDNNYEDVAEYIESFELIPMKGVYGSNN